MHAVFAVNGLFGSLVGAEYFGVAVGEHLLPRYTSRPRAEAARAAHAYGGNLLKLLIDEING